MEDAASTWMRAREGLKQQRARSEAAPSRIGGGRDRPARVSLLEGGDGGLRAGSDAFFPFLILTAARSVSDAALIRIISLL
jgi:hypothetical protein